ncbi:MAG: efflux RND transporter periplasmic adaptor subunit [Gammaproteobacteria bacterium]|nr:efflux RND transporter periplasmic adaptor subunit [Gammaproteobacteria bacterium]
MTIAAATGERIPIMKMAGRMPISDSYPARPRFPMALLGVCLTLVVAACNEQVTEQEPVIRPVKVRIIGKADASARREYPGSIRAFQHADMGFEVGGRIEEFYVSEGDDVVQGEVLARLDPRDYEANLKASQANLRKAESDLRRSKNIYKEDPGAISTETIDTHQRAVDVSRANLAISQKAVEDTKLRAPFSGRMARKLVEDFQNVQAKEPVLILQDTSTLEIEINLPERDVAGAPINRERGAVQNRTKPEVIVSALPSLKFAAWIKEFASTADPVTRTFSAKLNFKNPGNVNILPGMTARVQITVNPERAWSVPVSAALADDSGKPFVWKVDAESMAVSRVQVELGNLLDDRVRITSGLDEGDMVAISGVNELRDDMVVRILEP